VEPGDTTARRFGIAFDLGTTTVVATLLDLSTGTPAGVESTLNSQQPFGADVITRISATMMDPGNLDKLQNLARETLAELAQAVCAQGGVEPHEVYEVAVAGNATMTHLVLGIDPEPLGMAPFIMATRLYPEVLAADLGLGGVVHPRARAVVFPAFGAYVGGDITAGQRDGPGRPGPAVRRHRHQLRDRAGQPGLAAGHGRAGRTRVRGRRDQVRDAGRRRRHRGGHDDPG
jgi:uncharacterized 2Fe-2S/4Fe-4S cluster protein (DUF4445 family)